MTSFQNILEKYRKYSFSSRDQGRRFEKLIQNFLKTYRVYSNLFDEVWMWEEFPFRKEISNGQDIGIDLVAKTNMGDYWAIQCKCFQKDSYIDKKDVDTFLSISGKSFKDENLQTKYFTQRLWISTTNKWNSNAEITIQNQNPPFLRLSLYDLENAEVDWDLLEKNIYGGKAEITKKTPMKHQIEAIEATHEYFKSEERGKLIMACGTGKTFTSLKIAEKETNNNGLILFLVPSIALIGQTLREWSTQAEKPINAICICSDNEVSKQKIEDTENNFNLVDLALPASTNVENIVKQFENIKKTRKNNNLTVVFSTYQSIDIISEAQKELSKRNYDKYIFDLIICDEAHRTTGVILTDKNESNFTKVHNKDFIISKKRLYMTATPRLYSEEVKKTAKENPDKIDLLCSMDDENIYGKEIYRIGFGRAVDEGLLSDYKVIVLTVNENAISKNLKERLTTAIEREVDNNDIAKLIGCINALSKNLPHEEELIKSMDPNLMKTAVAFCQNIKTSKQIENLFNNLKDIYYNELNQEEKKKMVVVEAQHIDGAMSAIIREEKLSWLKKESENNNICKLLSNVRCLSEGVDVPSLDAAIFLSEKNSQVEIVQSVGRVMRKAPNKKYGYIIIPVVIPYNESPEEYLNKGNKFKNVWKILNALRSHDDRFNAKINTLTLNNIKEGKNSIEHSPIIIDDISSENNNQEVENNNNLTEEEIKKYQLSFDFGEYKDKIRATIVKKVGDKKYFEAWALEVADIVKANINRINDILNKNIKAKNEFDKFLNNIHKEINPSVTEQDVIEMLSQHLITQPIFEVLFEGYDFIKNNPISKSMLKIIELLEKETPRDEIEKLNKFYNSIQNKIRGVNTTDGRQKVIKDLYENFFQIAFKEASDKLGIVYTPVEVVDFIIHSVSDILEKEFNKKITDKNINIIDPFTGTGTFITRLLQSGLIKPEDLKRKYKKELFANEIVLLAYYIASVNIENIYHSLLPENSNYETFDGICLTDTFQLYETNEERIDDDLSRNNIANHLIKEEENSERIKRQKKSPITIVIGNPPYSIGQESGNDNNQNQHYPKLEQKIANTYVKYSKAQKSKMYNSYIKAFRWASDRINNETGGIVGFITISGWLDGSSADGFRYCLENEFSNIYIFDLKGAIRGKSGEIAKKEGGNIFNIESGVAITILVKKPNYREKAKIYYYSIGNYLKKIEKLNILKNYKSLLNKNIQWQEIIPDKYNDWLTQRGDLFNSFISIEPEKKYDIKSQSFFINYSGGICSNRDVWVYNFSRNKLKNNINKIINYYNEERIKINSNKQKDIIIKKTEGKWADNLKNFLKKNIEIKENKDSYFVGIYRPFCKQNIYFNKYLIERQLQMPSIFPNKNIKNLCICIASINSRKDFFCLITNKVTDLGLNTDGTQCFPLYYYEKVEKTHLSLFDNSEEEYIKRDAISDFILKRAKDNYGPNITKEDIFYYVYGILHSPIYREKFKNDLKKVLPRIPFVDTPKDFHNFIKAGKELANLHLNYETIPANKDCKVIGRETNNFTVEKMKFAKNGKDKDKSIIIYNSSIRIENIPSKAYKYVINGKSAIEWIMDRYQIKIDEESGIINNPNDWAVEQNKPSYILDLLLSIIEVSIKTVDIIDNLPELEFKEENNGR